MMVLGNTETYSFSDGSSFQGASTLPHENKEKIIVNVHLKFSL